MLIYKVLRDPEWQQLLRDGTTNGAPIDLRDGYIHMSTADQLAETLSRHFASEDQLQLLALESETLSDVVWEPSRHGQLFPHLYRRMNLAEILWHRPIPLGPNGHQIGELV